MKLVGKKTTIQMFLLLTSAASISEANVNVSSSGVCEENLERLAQNFKSYQTKALIAFKEISASDQLCAQPTRLESQLRQERVERAKQKLDLITVMVTALASEKQQATVPHPEVYGKVNGSVELSCESGGQPLNLCVWERIVNGQRQVIIVDQEVVRHGGQTSVHGIHATQDVLVNGKCSLNIPSLKKNDFGHWSCTLMAQTGNAFGGRLSLIDENELSSVYFATSGGVKRYFSETAEVEAVANSNRSDTLYGVAFDWLRNKLYWNSRFVVCRANTDGTNLETVLDTEKHGCLNGLAFDWVSGNVYIASSGGFILACSGRPANSFTCATVLFEEGDIQGIALDPAAGVMYWTKYLQAGSSIWRSDLDGSNGVRILDHLKYPYGIAIDFSSRRLYWADFEDSRIQSSDLQGRNFRANFKLPNESYPTGVVVIGHRIYWGTWGSGKLQSGGKGGRQIISHYNGADTIHHLAVVPSTALPRNRTNHCEVRGCPKVCVLTATSYRCLK